MKDRFIRVHKPWYWLHAVDLDAATLQRAALPEIDRTLKAQGITDARMNHAIKLLGVEVAKRGKASHRKRSSNMWEISEENCRVR